MSLRTDSFPFNEPMREKRSFHEWWKLVKRAAAAWKDDYAPSMGAALAYYTVFSLTPIVLIVISVAGLIFGEEAARGEIVGQLRGLMGVDAAKTIEDLLSSANKPGQGFTAMLFGIVMLVVGATTVFGELQDALDRIWRAPVRDTSKGLWGLVRARFLSFSMILAIAFLLMVSLVVSAGMAALGKWVGGAFGSWEVIAQIINALLSFGVTTIGFSLIYKLMPRVKVRWHDVWLGAAVTAFLFTIGRFLIGLYIGKSGVGSTYGAASSLVIIFVWVYYSAQVFLMGAEFTWIYATTFGSMRTLATSTDSGAAAAPTVPLRSEPTGAVVSERVGLTAAPSGRGGWKDLVLGAILLLLMKYFFPRPGRRGAKGH